MVQSYHSVLVWGFWLLVSGWGFRRTATGNRRPSARRCRESRGLLLDNVLELLLHDPFHALRFSMEITKATESPHPWIIWPKHRTPFASVVPAPTLASLTLTLPSEEPRNPEERQPERAGFRNLGR